MILKYTRIHQRCEHQFHSTEYLLEKKEEEEEIDPRGDEYLTTQQSKVENTVCL